VPTSTWARLGPVRRDAVVAAAEAEFGAHGFSGGSLNAIAREAGVAKGSLFQYFADKLDLFTTICDGASQRVRDHVEARVAVLQVAAGDDFFAFLTDLLEEWVAYFAAHPVERSLTAAVDREPDSEARAAVRGVVNRHYLEVLGPLLERARRTGQLRADADLDALLALILLIAPHLALAPFVAGLDPVLGLAEGGPEQPGLAIRRLVAPLAVAFAAVAVGERE
jgi:AcrR family transcriptional regulator